MKPVSDGGKKDSRRQPLNRKEADMNMSVFHENCRRAREDDLPPMTTEEREEFIKPRTTHAETLAFGDDPDAPLLQPNRCDHTGDMFGGDK